MIKRVAAIAKSVCDKNANCEYVVATDDDRIAAFCSTNGIPSTMTSVDCQNGTERCLQAAKKRPSEPKLVINLQGDNPLCPPQVVQSLIDSWRACAADVYTPCVRLSWPEYDSLIKSKATTPFSGTTVLVDNKNYALAFSKNVVPAVRDVRKAQENLPQSPVRRHIGLYAYTMAALSGYFQLPPSTYEANFVEGLEQMRFLENGCTIKVVEVDYGGRKTTSGVDSPEDVKRVEEILAEFGELNLA